MARRDAELQDLRPEVVEVAAHARLGLDARMELVAALRGGRRRAHTQRVEVVADLRVVAVLGEVADREVQRPHRPPTASGLRVRSARVRDSRSVGRFRCVRDPAGRYRPGEVALRHVLIDAGQLLLGARADTGQLGAVGQRAALEVQIGRQAADAQHRLGVARAGVRRREDLVQRVHARRHAVGVGTLEQQEARHRMRVGRGGPRAQVRMEAADGLQQDQRRAVRRAPPRRAGSATRSMRSTMSATSIRPPASRKHLASSRSIERSATPQISAVRCLTY